MTTYTARPQIIPCQFKATVEIASGSNWFTFCMTLLNDGKPCRPKLEQAIAAHFPGYSLVCWWTND
jgi:hypothetical protein